MNVKKIILIVIPILIIWPVTHTLSIKIRTERLINKYLTENNLNDNVKESRTKFDAKRWCFEIIIEFKDEPGYYYDFEVYADKDKVFSRTIDKRGNSIHKPNAKYLVN